MEDITVKWYWPHVEPAAPPARAMTDAPFADRDFVADAQAHFDALANYQVTLKSTSAGAAPVEVLYCYRKPGFVRMDFIRPHAGATLIYSPETGKVTLWPFGFDTFPRLTLSPESRMIKSPKGHRVDQSDLGALLVNVSALQHHGDTQVVGAEAFGMRRASHVIVTGRPGHVVAGVSRYELWFDVNHGLPVKVASDGPSREPIETVLMEDLRIDVPGPQLRSFG
ncbi:DUF1571 domain-containing protein [Pararobbsia alpina]|uniref:DUF1571 domain-containing protein n=1 Tax=Pararobbsia alpina TaxID=621374 RepID=UPI001FE2CD5F|nr:DUF1571 domain-containing protein [Pararobbsia alpina]